MTKILIDEAVVRQALESLEKALRYHGVMLMSDPPKDAWKYYRVEQTAHEAITALRQALEQPAPAQACDHDWKYIGSKRMYKMPDAPPECKTEAEKTAFAFGWFKALESVREQPAQEPVAKVCHGLEGHIGWNPDLEQLPDEGTALYTAPPAPAQEPEFFTHSVDAPYDWSEWVCPDPKGYLMKCCDCGLVHEAEFKVVRYQSETEREDCEMVDDPNLQAVFRMRRSDQWSPVDTAHRAGGLPIEQPAPAQEPVAWIYNGNLHEFDPSDWATGPVSPLYTTPPAPAQPWVGLTDEERRHLRKCNQQHDAFALAVEALLKGKNT